WLTGDSLPAPISAPVYVVRAYQDWNHSVWEGAVDAQTGALIGAGKLSPVSQLDPQRQAKLARLSQVHATVPEAVVMAADHENGKVTSASLEATNAAMVIKLTVVKNDAPNTVIVDAQSGQLLS